MANLTNINNKFLVTTGGDVGIGATSPRSKLEVDGGIMMQNGENLEWGNTYDNNAPTIFASTNYLQFAPTGASGVASNSMKLTTTGLGIGTTSPAYKLDVSGGNMAIRNSAGPQLLFFEPGRAYTDGMRLLRYQDKLSLTYGWNANEEALTVVGGTGSDVGNVGIGTTSPTNIIHTSTSSNAVGRFESTDGVAYIRINDTADSFYIGTESQIGSIGGNTGANDGNLNIDLTNGNVGIGTTSPDYKLEVESTSDADLVSIKSTAIANNTQMRLGISGNDSVISGTGGSVGNLSFKTYGSERMRIESSGNVAIGATTTQARLEVRNAADGSTTAPQFLIYGGASSYGAFHFLDSDAYHILTNSAGRDIEIICDSGGVKLGPGDTAWSSNSDENLKENIKPLNNVLDKIKNYRCVEYNFKDDENKDKKIGFIAQDWQKDFSQVVNKNKQNVLSIKYTETIPVLLKAIQELEARVKELENK